MTYGFKITRGSDGFTPSMGSLYRTPRAAKMACERALIRIAIRGENHGPLNVFLTLNGTNAETLGKDGVWTKA